MPLSSVLPPPAILGSVSPEQLQDVRKLLAGESASPDHISPNRDWFIESVNRIHTVRKVLGNLISLGSEWLMADERDLHVSVSTATVMPGARQRLAEWHQDAGDKIDYRAIGVVSALPTIFAHGQLPEVLRDELQVKQQHKEDYSDLIEKALVADDLALFVPAPLEVVAIDDSHMHRSPINRSRVPIDRTFVRISTDKSR